MPPNLSKLHFVCNLRHLLKGVNLVEKSVNTELSVNVYCFSLGNQIEIHYTYLLRSFLGVVQKGMFIGHKDKVQGSSFFSKQLIDLADFFTEFIETQLISHCMPYYHKLNCSLQL